VLAVPLLRAHLDPLSVFAPARFQGVAPAKSELPGSAPNRAATHLYIHRPPSAPTSVKPASMAFFDLSGRLEHDVCNLPFSEEIRDRVEFLETHSLIVWIGKNHPYTDVNHIAEAFTSKFGLDYSSIPLPVFLVTIFDRDAFEEAAGRNSFPFGGREFRLCRWSLRDHGNRAAMRYYVRLGLDRIPLHMWTDNFAARVIGRSCSLHFTKEHSRCREATDIFEELAWTADPCAIPLPVWLMVTDPDTSALSSFVKWLLWPGLAHSIEAPVYSYL
jgi:hypothetical protein